MTCLRCRAGVATVVLALATAAGPTAASTSEAWSTHAGEVVSACEAASGLNQPHAAGELIEFDDSVGYTAVLIAGRYPQPHMHGAPGRVLCLFDKRTRHANISLADGILHRRANPTPPP
jgi:hypothetical protein